MAELISQEFGESSRLVGVTELSSFVYIDTQYARGRLKVTRVRAKPTKGRYVSILINDEDVENRYFRIPNCKDDILTIHTISGYTHFLLVIDGSWTTRVIRDKMERCRYHPYWLLGYLL
jgi:hypothetical protein